MMGQNITKPQKLVPNITVYGPAVDHKKIDFDLHLSPDQLYCSPFLNQKYWHDSQWSYSKFTWVKERSESGSNNLLCHIQR